MIFSLRNTNYRCLQVFFCSEETNFQTTSTELTADLSDLALSRHWLVVFEVLRIDNLVTVAMRNTQGSTW